MAISKSLKKLPQPYCWCVENSIKLIGDLLINGLVHDEADKLLFYLDDISISKSKESVLKEIEFFISFNRNLKYSLSIVWLMLFRKTTLTSVRNWFLVQYFLSSDNYFYCVTDFQFCINLYYNIDTNCTQS
jgi:hypothetical protein